MELLNQSQQNRVKFLHSREWRNKIERGEVSGLDTDANHYALMRYSRGGESGGCAGAGACSSRLSRRTSANVYFRGSRFDDLAMARVSKRQNNKL